MNKFRSNTTSLPPLRQSSPERPKSSNTKPKSKQHSKQQLKPPRSSNKPTTPRRQGKASTAKSIPKMKFVSTDGTIFSDRTLYRRHEMKTQYTFQGKENATLTKNPGSINGQPFDIIDCNSCCILLLDNCDQVQIDNVVSSKIFIAGSSGSVFIRNCVNCTFTIACKQLRTRESRDCRLNLHTTTNPAIETSWGMQFAPFNGAYPGHDKALDSAGLDIYTNKWSQVYDFNDPSNTGKNWSIVGEEDDERTMWCPLGPVECDISRRLFDSSIKPKTSTKSTTGQTSNEYIQCGDSVQQSSLPDDDGKNGFLSFGKRLWSIVSYSISSARLFCIGILLSSIDCGKHLLTWSD